MEHRGQPDNTNELSLAEPLLIYTYDDNGRHGEPETVETFEQMADAIYRSGYCVERIRITTRLDAFVWDSGEPPEA